MSEVGVIYGLAARGEIRYVGKTASPLDLRLRQHMQAASRGAHTYVARWMRGAKSVEIIVLERDPVGGLDAAERAWIATLRMYGCLLTNLTEGGDGMTKGSALAREAGRRGGQALRGRAKSPEHRAKIAASLSGRKNGPMSAEGRQKISAARKGKPSNHKTGCSCSFCTDPGRGARIRWGVE